MATSTSPKASIFDIIHFNPSEKSTIIAKKMAFIRKYWFQNSPFNSMFISNSNTEWQIKFAENLMKYESIYDNLINIPKYVGQWAVIHDDKIHFFGISQSGFDSAKEHMESTLEQIGKAGGPLMICVGWEHLNLDDPGLNLPLFDVSGLSFSFLGDIVTSTPAGLKVRNYFSSFSNLSQTNY